MEYHCPDCGCEIVESDLRSNGFYVCSNCRQRWLSEELIETVVMPVGLDENGELDFDGDWMELQL